MKCPYCHKMDSQVIDTRELPGGEGIRRRRLCTACRQRFITYERVQPVSLMIVKKDGRREEYDRRKLLTGLQIACAKRPVSATTLEELVDDVEAELFRRGSNEVASTVVGELVLSRLKEIDQVAYVRFASVYLNFIDLTEMGTAIAGLLERQSPAEA